MGLFRAWRRRQMLRHHPLPAAHWNAVRARVPMVRSLPPADDTRLQELATLFLHEKEIYGADGLEVSASMRLRIAAQACLPILGLDLDWYAGWYSVVVYPAAFIPRHQHVDEAGVVTVGEEVLTGEAWRRGPVVLSWPDVETPSRPGTNVIIHELAHKLDMLNGAADGWPPLHRGMSVTAWTEALSGAYTELRARLARDEEPPIDPYGAQNPGEFFAVLSEMFFVAPAALLGIYPAVYHQLKAFYRQDPAGRARRGAA